MGMFAGTPWDRPAYCERCEKPESECTCPPTIATRPAQGQTAKLAVEKRKRGKVVTVIRGLKPDETNLTLLLTQLKQTCGAGGKLEADEVEIQGDHLSRIKALLSEMGYTVRG